MAIQDRLRRDRYGEFNPYIPNKDELYSSLNITTSRRRSIIRLLHINNIYKQVWDIYSLHYSSGKYSYTYNNLITDYSSRLSYKSRAWTSKVLKLYLRYLYFHKKHTLYGNNFNNYCISWYNSLLWEIRKSILKQMILNNEINPISNFNDTRSNMFYPLVKPMYYKHTMIRANKIYNIFETVYSSKVLR